MASKVYPVRASEEEKARWQEAADAAGMSFNAWAKEALNSQVDLDKALARLEEAVPVTQVVIQPARPVTQDFKFKPDPKGGKKKGR